MNSVRRLRGDTHSHDVRRNSARMARVKAVTTTFLKRSRLEARRARGHTHCDMGMSTVEERLAAILSFTLSILALAFA